MPPAMPPASTIARLQELLVALDSRLAQPNQPMEAVIIRDASVMRARTLARLAELMDRHAVDAEGHRS